MGLNAIRCEGYAEAGETRLSEGRRVASDFDGEDIVVGAALVLAGAVTGALVTSICYEWDEKPQYPAKRVTIESGPYRLDGSNGTRVVHEEHANETYRIRLEKIDHELRLIGKVLMPYDVAHLNVSVPGTSGGERHITLEDWDSFDLSPNMMVYAKNVERDFADLIVTEKYSEPLE